MPTLNEIKKRINGVKTTRKITQAMNMVAASKFRKTHAQLLAARPYSDSLQRLVDDLLNRQQDLDQLYFKATSQTVGIISIAGDRGLCGGFNNNIYKETLRVIHEHKPQEVEMLLIGSKAVSFFKRQNRPILAQFPQFFTNISRYDAEIIAEQILDAYRSGRWGQVWLVYNNFKSAITQNTRATKLLPLSHNPAPTTTLKTDQNNGSSASSLDYIYEPNKKEVRRRLLEKYIHFIIYRVLMESSTAEQAARMTAMEAATDNAQNMIDKYTLWFNRERQAVITTEIAEIVGGAEALS